MKRSLVILLTAVSISAMTAGTAFPAFAEATEAEAEEIGRASCRERVL